MAIITAFIFLSLKVSQNNYIWYFFAAPYNLHNYAQSKILEEGFSYQYKMLLSFRINWAAVYR